MRTTGTTFLHGLLKPSMTSASVVRCVRDGSGFEKTGADMYTPGSRPLLLEPRFSGAAPVSAQPTVEKPQPTPEMHEFINLDDYARFEPQHAGWVLANALESYILRYGFTSPEEVVSAACPSLLEIGCSTGTSTEPIARDFLRADQQKPSRNASRYKHHPERHGAFERYDAIDIDPKAIRVLQQNLRDKGLALGGKVTANVADAMEFNPMEYAPKGNKPYSHALMQFSLSHFDDAGKRYLLRHLLDIVEIMNWGTEKMTGIPDRFSRDQIERNGFTRQGYIIITDEFLPRFNDQATENEALWKHHGAVIFDALIKGNFELAELELEALYSGLHKTGDFKVSCEEFEDMLWQLGFGFEKYKTFPLNPDLVPFDPASPPEGIQPAETAANALWRRYSRDIFKAARDCRPVDGNLQLPKKPRQLLRELAGKFKAAGLNGLRETPKPGDITLDWKSFQELEIEPNAKSSDGEDWGVYTYKITKRGGYQSKLDEELSQLLALEPDGDLDRVVSALYPRLTREASYYDSKKERDIPLESCLSPLTTPWHRWYFAAGQERPTYRELQDPVIRRDWQAKVEFSKTCIKQLLIRIAQEDCKSVREMRTTLEKYYQNTPGISDVLEAYGLK